MALIFALFVELVNSMVIEPSAAVTPETVLTYAVS